MAKVLLVTDIFPPQIGGPATFIDRLAHSLATRDHDVTVVCSSPQGRDATDEARPFTVRRVSFASRERYEVMVRLRLALEMSRHRLIFVNGLERYVAQVNQIVRRPFVLKIVGDTVWETARSKADSPARDSFTNLSCFTDDGIELWSRRSGAQGISWSAEAIRIERRPVAAEEVRLPHALLALNWWDRSVSASATAADHETIMELSDSRARPDGSKPASPTVRTTRRAGPWLIKEVIAGTQRRIEIFHDSIRMRLTYERGRRDVEEELTIARPDPDPTKPEPASPINTFQPVPGDRYDTVLGERCRWFDMTPGMQDASTSACFTDDGIMLKEDHRSRIYRGTWTATRFIRRPVAIDEVKPPAELLQPRTWGLD